MRSIVFRLWLLFPLMGASFGSFGQNGSPIIQNVSKVDYSGGTQNYEIIQDEFGFIYSANNDGLLMYDGAKWRCFPLPNRTNLRSIEAVDEGILAGGQNEFGLFRKTKNGKLVFEDLRVLFPEEASLEDIWDITSIEDDVLIRTRKSLWVYRNGGIELVSDEGSFVSSFLSKEKYYYQNDNVLYSYPNHDSIAVFKAGERCVTDLTYKGKVLFALENDGYSFGDGSKLDNNLLTFSNILGESGLNCLKPFEGGYLIGTKTAGLFLVNQNLEVVDVYDVQTGLQRNEVINVHIDSNNDFWLATANGIDRILQSSPYRYLSPDGQLHGAGYSYCSYRGEDYYATSYGVFVWKKDGVAGYYELLQGTKGLAWSVKELNGLLWIGHEKGCLVYDGQKVQVVEGLPGTWIYFNVEGDENHVVVGHYEGVSVLEKQANSWVLRSAAFGLEESCRLGAYEGDDVWWISHPYRGAWRIKLNRERWELDDVQFVGEERGFPSKLHICASQCQVSSYSCPAKYGSYPSVNRVQCFLWHAQSH